jgi:hypothetical protein
MKLPVTSLYSELSEDHRAQKLKLHCERSSSIPGNIIPT